MAEFFVMILLKWQRGHTGARMTGKLVRWYFFFQEGDLKLRRIAKKFSKGCDRQGGPHPIAVTTTHDDRPHICLQVTPSWPPRPDKSCLVCLIASFITAGNTWFLPSRSLKRQKSEKMQRSRTCFQTWLRRSRGRRRFSSASVAATARSKGAGWGRWNKILWWEWWSRSWTWWWLWFIRWVLEQSLAPGRMEGRATRQAGSQKTMTLEKFSGGYQRIRYHHPLDHQHILIMYFHFREQKRSRRWQEAQLQYR